MSDADIVTSTADREIVIERVVNASRERVFRAWTDPTQVAQWWGPKGFTNTIHEMDVRPGGSWRFVMHGPDGADYPNKIVYLEVAEPERLVYSHGDDTEEARQFHVTVTFTEQDGKTKVTLRLLFETVEECEKTKAFGAVEGGNSTLDCLEEFLAQNPEASAGEFVISRVFDAPRELVWKAYTEPEHLMRWWGPKGFTMRVARMELRPGGVFHYGLEAPNGQVMWGKLVYREIEAPERFVYLVSFTDEEGNAVRHPLSPNWPLEVLNTQTFAEQDGKTTVTIRSTPHAATELECQTFEAALHSMRQGVNGSWDQLAEYLARQ